MRDLIGRLARRRGETKPSAATLPDLSLAAYTAEKGARAVGPFPEVVDPVVSVVIPAFGEAEMTRRCLASLTASSSSVPFEVVVADDGSDPPLADSLSTIQGLRLCRSAHQGGFVAAANLGASHARGRFLVFLNNDTFVTDGWLEALWKRASGAHDVGIVGAQLVSPDGFVQEAGAIVWRDGSATNYGRGSHPEEPTVSYVREVDYCSAACLLIERELFAELGSFDARYAPGYYEDVDLAFAARARALRVIYEPAARVYHEEGGTAGTDLAVGMKQAQEINRERFVDRWSRALEQQPLRAAGVHKAKDRSFSRRCLVVDRRMPTPDRDAGSSRLVRILEELLTLGWRPTLAPYDLEDDEPQRKKLEALGVEVLRRPFVDHLDRYLKGQATGFDAVILTRLGVAHRLARIVRRRCPKARLIFDTVDLKSVRDLREADLLDDAKLRKRAQQVRSQEAEVIDSVDVTLVTSRVERDYLRQQNSESLVSVVPTWYPIVQPELSFQRRSGALFIGGFRHAPNADGLAWFLAEVLPRIQRLSPSFQLHVVGEDPPPSLTLMASDQVIFHGFVPDTSSFFQRSRMSIAPLRFGAGLKGKVHQSLAHGLPCVATPIAAEGMGLMPAVHVALAETAEDFADAVLHVNSNVDLWQRLSVEGQQHVERYFSQNVLRAGLAEALGSFWT